MGYFNAKIGEERIETILGPPALGSFNEQVEKLVMGQ